MSIILRIKETTQAADGMFVLVRNTAAFEFFSRGSMLDAALEVLNNASLRTGLIQFEFTF